MTDASPLAAWQRRPGTPLAIEPIVPPAPGANEILVRNAAIAINPVDWLLQDSAIFDWLTYPTILGSDVAGVVAAVGSGVDRFAVGDRVLGQSVNTAVNQPAQGAFQTHTIVPANMACAIPDSMAFTDAAVLPLGVGTAAGGLFERNLLALRHPSASPEPTGETVLVWGGSSSVGCNAIQLAVAAGYDVVTTASPRHAAMLKGLGAREVIDHATGDVVEAVAGALAGRRLAGVLHATGNMEQSLAVAARSEGRRFVACTLPPPAQLPAGVEAGHIFGTSLKDNEVSRAVYGDFLPDALAAGRYRTAPPARIVGRGLAALQSALEAQKAGVSGEKIVVDLG